MSELYPTPDSGEIDRPHDDEAADFDEQISGALLDAEGAYLNEMGRYQLLSAADEVDLAKKIEAGVYARQLLDGSVEPQTDESREALASERELLERIALEGDGAFQQFVNSNLRLVASIAKRSIRAAQTMRYGDLLQEGNVGMMHAVEKFDFTKGYKFSTYATWWIKQAIGRAMANQDLEVRLPVHMLEKKRKMEAIKSKFTVEHGRPPTDEELSGAMAISVEALTKLQNDIRPTTHIRSLNDLIESGGDTEYGDLLSKKSDISVEDEATQNVLRGQLHDMLGMLTPRERDVIERSFGLNGHKEQTLDEIKVNWGVTRERIRQLKDKALKKLAGSAELQILNEDYTAAPNESMSA